MAKEWARLLFVVILSDFALVHESVVMDLVSFVHFVQITTESRCSAKSSIRNWNPCKLKLCRKRRFTPVRVTRWTLLVPIFFFSLPTRYGSCQSHASWTKRPLVEYCSSLTRDRCESFIGFPGYHSWYIPAPRLRTSWMELRATNSGLTFS